MGQIWEQETHQNLLVVNALTQAEGERVPSVLLITEQKLS